jgi:hypothetical protein
MANPSSFPGDLIVTQGAIIAKQITPTATFSPAMGYLNSQQKFKFVYGQKSGTAVTADNKPLLVVDGATGAVVNFQACMTGVLPTSSDTVTVDLQKSTGGGAFASILTAAIQFTSSVGTLRTMLAASIATASLVQGDILEVVVTVSGSSGQGLCVELATSETPQ